MSTGSRLQQAPELSGASVADHRPLPAGKGGRHQPPVPRDSRMPHRIDTAVNAMQATHANARKHGVVAQTGTSKLMDGHNSVLSSGHLGHPQIPAVTLFGHIPIKVTSDLDSPPGIDFGR